MKALCELFLVFISYLSFTLKNLYLYLSLLLKSLKKLLKSSYITTFLSTKAIIMQFAKKVYRNINKLRLYISKTG